MMFRSETERVRHACSSMGLAYLERLLREAGERLIYAKMEGYSAIVVSDCGVEKP